MDSGQKAHANVSIIWINISTNCLRSQHFLHTPTHIQTDTHNANSGRRWAKPQLNGLINQWFPDKIYLEEIIPREREGMFCVSKDLTFCMRKRKITKHEIIRYLAIKPWGVLKKYKRSLQGREVSVFWSSRQRLHGGREAWAGPWGIVRTWMGGKEDTPS